MFGTSLKKTHLIMAAAASARRVLAGLSQARASTGARCMSSTAKVWIDKNTRVICQGFTGKQVGK
jgi:succinyl-CoA synthetase alpha subunit